MGCRKMIPLALLFILSTEVAAQSPIAVAHVEAPDVRGINFKRLQPSTNDSLRASVAEPSDASLQILQIDADVLKTYPKWRVEVIGFTDSEECAGRACVDLSLRRATMVVSWLITHGVSKSQLSQPEGHGDAEPIEDNGNSKGRARNRRVELRARTYPDGKPYAYPSN
jgi:outer membrane protein OmpA-like peptidoglycan-associated protein